MQLLREHGSTALVVVVVSALLFGGDVWRAVNGEPAGHHAQVPSYINADYGRSIGPPPLVHVAFCNS